LELESELMMLFEIFQVSTMIMTVAVPTVVILDVVFQLTSRRRREWLKAPDQTGD